MSRIHVQFLIRLVLIAALTFGVAVSAPGISLLPSVSADDDDDEGGDDDDDDDDDDGERIDVSGVVDYRVEVDCEHDDEADVSSCEFAARAPSEEQSVTHLTVPVENVCAPVDEDEFELATPDPVTRITGYSTSDDESTLTLEIEGKVTVEGEAIYWLESGSALIPARGDGLDCAGSEGGALGTATTEPAGKEESDGPTTTAIAIQLTPEVSDSAGAIVVESHSCPIAEPVADYDWFAECEPAPGQLRFRIAPVDDQAASGKTGATIEGAVQFGNLLPGVYSLTQADGNWCHAKSDGVDDEGNVIVTAGEHTTVWVFSCAEAETTATSTT